jgi:hypothetical protein
MRKPAHLAAAAVGAATLAMFLSPAAANASTSASTAHGAAATIRSATAELHSAAAQASGGCTVDSAGETYCQYKASPRVNCGGYNGKIYWEDDWSGTIYIGTWGEVWSTCDASTTLYLTWSQDMGLRHYNEPVQSAGPWHTVGVNYVNPKPAESIGGMSGVSVTVCSNYGGGWHCGKPYPV